ncbi:MAG TPA: hypothetical protein VHX16_10550 [Chloroflexota bacterium]|jgi:hypothetical protein|nr:hypothetical protein [Chloroflexota bacterium]
MVQWLARFTPIASLLTVWMGIAPTVSAADPDIKVDSVKLFTSQSGEVNDRVIQFTIKNVGAGDSPVPFGKIFITGGNAVFTDGQKEILLAIPELKANGGSFTGFAPLAGPCDGTVLKVFVQATGETNFADNDFGPITLCPPLPPSPPSAANPDPDDLIDFGGCACQRQPQTLDIKMDRWKHITEYGGDHLNVPDHAVGFYQKDGRFVFDSTSTAVTVLNLHFDLGRGAMISPKSVSNATLTYTEHAEFWTSGSGAGQEKPGCVTRIFATTTGWFTVDSIDQLPVRYLGPVDPARKEIDVTEHIRAALASPKDPALVNGFQLRGPFDSVNGNDFTSCMSNLDDETLHITYTP